MKVLFISQGGSTQDYQRDCLMIGLRQLLGPDVVDVNKIESLYVGADRSSMYGKGFSLYAELPDIEVDRTDIPRKIAKKYFDLILYGSIHRCQDYLHESAAMYPGNRIVFIDGEDHPVYLKGLGGLYFKRELHSPQPGVFPIHFAIPDEKVLGFRPIKMSLVSPMDPIDKSTYVYDSEESYYQQYADSYFAPTMKKAGWDCMRHYEILANWCLPYFRCFDACPPTIMQDMPRKELRLIQECFDYGVSDKIMTSLYDSLIESVMATVRTRLTTSYLARYVFDTIGVRQRVIACV